MAITVPTVDQAKYLHQFIQDRNEDEWRQAMADDGLSEARLDTVRRLSNCTKLAVASNAAALLIALRDGARGPIETYWQNLTSCGEQWQEHPDWNHDWANPARMAL